MSEKTELGDWRSNKGVIERCIEARKRKLFTDVNLVVGEGEAVKTYPAHKNILAFSSPVFEAMFFGTMAEQKTDIAITDLNPEAFDIFLSYVYGNEEVTFPSIDIAAETFIVADKYLVADLKNLAEDHISEESLDDQEFWEIIHQKRFFCIPALKELCMDYIRENAASLFKSYLFASLSEEVIEAVLQMDRIKISEYELLSAVVSWGISSILREKDLKTKLAPFLRHIRFSNFSVEEFCYFMDCHPRLLDSDDSLAIMKHLHKPSAYKLPGWCSPSTSKRDVNASEKK